MKLNRKHIFKIALCALLLIAIQGCSSHANYPVTRLLGWQPKDIKWEVLELTAKFKHENFNLFNMESHILIKAKIKVFGHDNPPYKIQKLHITQRYIVEDLKNVAPIKINPRWGATFDNQEFLKKRDNQKIYFGLIEITPVFSNNLETEKINIFDLIIEEPIKNWSWSRNYYRVKIGNKQVDLGTFQGK